MGITSNRGQELGSGASSMISLSHQSQREREREKEVLYTWLLQHSIQAFLLIKEEEEKEGWLAYFALLALLAIHVTSLCTTTTHKESTSLPSLWSFIQQLMWDANLILGRFIIKCMCIVGGLLMLMLIHLAEIIQKFSSPPNPPFPPGPQHHIQASKQASLGEVYVGLFHEVSTWGRRWG